SDLAPDSEIAAALGHELAEVIAERSGRLHRLQRLLKRRQDTVLLSRDSGNQTRLTPEDHGRLAQVRVIAHRLVNATDPTEIARYEQDFRGLLDNLGLSEGPGSEQRRAAVARHLPGYVSELVSSL